MNEFFMAFYNYVVAEPHNDFYNAISGRFTYGEAIENCPKPYAVFFGVTNTPTDTFTEDIDDISVQVNVYSDGNYMEAGTILGYCKALFNGAVLTVNGLDATLIKEMETPPWRDGVLWAASIEFSVLIQED